MQTTSKQITNNVNCYGSLVPLTSSSTEDSDFIYYLDVEMYVLPKVKKKKKTREK